MILFFFLVVDERVDVVLVVAAVVLLIYPREISSPLPSYTSSSFPGQKQVNHGSGERNARSLLVRD
jgi:hypothetical protein